MSGEPTRRVPQQAERPTEEASTGVELERQTLAGYSLSELGSKSALRAAVYHEQSVRQLNERIGVLQTKLDASEQRCESLVDQRNRDGSRLEYQATDLAELRHAERTSKLLFRDGTISLAIGSVLVSVAGLFAHPAVRWTIAGTGGGMIVVALWICKMIQRNIWPAKRPISDTDQPPGVGPRVPNSDDGKRNQP
jgi:hypothetical protein